MSGPAREASLADTLLIRVSYALDCLIAPCMEMYTPLARAKIR